jgi:glycogen debranching enzyme
VLLPEGLSLNLAFKQVTWIGAEYLPGALFGRKGDGAPDVRPGPHAIDGRYTRLELRRRTVHAAIETAHVGSDLVVLVTPLEAPATPVTMVVETGMLWNRPGVLRREGETLTAALPGRTISVATTGTVIEDPQVPVNTPYLAVALDRAVGVSTGSRRTLADIQAIVRERREEVLRAGAAPADLAETMVAIESALAWNTIFEPAFGRVVSTVGRLWNEEYGGYCLFGWDNFFLAYVSTLFSRDLALANFAEHLRSKTGDGFIPNDDRGNGTKSWDHSQAPVGALMLREIYRKYSERWLLESAFDDLLEWNRWWVKARLNDGLLSYGSHPARNPYGQASVHSKTTAGYESGMDDSPMYEDVPFNPQKNTLELQDVGLNSLYVADCRALAEIARAIGREREAAELTARAEAFGSALERLWSEDVGLYLNRRTDTGELSRRLTPVHFYPLLAGVPPPARAQRMVREHFFNRDEFFGDHLLPSVARNDPAFPKQRYWKGAVWPPLNYLVYLALWQYDLPEARRELAARSHALFFSEWKRRGYVSENYSAISGTGDDERLSSDSFHAWGTLMALPLLVERGVLPAPR